MDISLQKDEYRYLKKTYETSMEECVEAELSLPEYMPEILRIIRAAAVPKVNNCRTVGERVTVDGVCELRMIYTSDDGCIYAFSQQCAFTRYCENAEFSHADDVTAKAGVNYVNCRATSPKRAEIKASIRLSVSAYGGIYEDIVSLGDCRGIEEKCVPVSAMSLGCKKSRNFSMSETLNIENGGAAFILSSFAAAVPTEIKKIGNKIMIRGDAVVEISYVPCEDKSVAEHIRHVMPINQILEFDGMEEHYTGDVILNVSACDTVIKNDSSGDGRAFDIALGIDADVTMWEQKDFFVITDAYSVDGELELSKSALSFYSVGDEVRDTYVFKENVDVSKIGVSSIIDVSVETGEANAAYSENNLNISGSLKLSFIMRDTAGDIVTLEKMVDYNYERKQTEDISEPKCIADVTLCSLDCTLKSSSEIEVRAELKITGTLFNTVSVDAVSDMTLSERTTEKRAGAITVYFPCGEENLWDIARRYNTTVSAVSKENSLDGETTEDRNIIFIPSV